MFAMINPSYVPIIANPLEIDPHKPKQSSRSPGFPQVSPKSQPPSPGAQPALPGRHRNGLHGYRAPPVASGATPPSLSPSRRTADLPGQHLEAEQRRAEKWAENSLVYVGIINPKTQKCMSPKLWGPYGDHQHPSTITRKVDKHESCFLYVTKIDELLLALSGHVNQPQNDCCVVAVQGAITAISAVHH